MENEHYWRGRYEEVTQFRDKLIEELHKWKVAFGWTLAGIILGLFIAIIK